MKNHEESLVLAELQTPLQDVQIENQKNVDKNNSMLDILEQTEDIYPDGEGKTPDSDDEFDQEIPATISDEQGGDLLQRLAKFSSVSSIMVPLCRLVVNTRVRPLRSENEELKAAFRNEGYVKEKGMFILSSCLSDGSVIDVDDERKQKWGSIWVDINNEFELELQEHPILSVLSGKMFFVWEGNHRTSAWKELIAEEYWNDRKKHIRVMATFIEPDAKSEMQLVATLQRLNLLNEDAIIKTNLKDYLYNAKTICECGEANFMENLTAEEQKKLEFYRKLESKYGKKPWYPLTRVMLGRLVYAPLYKKDCKGRLAELPTSLPIEEIREKEKKIAREISKKYGRKMAKVLSIVNPALGKHWFDVLWSIPFESKKSVVTIEKLNQIATSALQEDMKVKMLQLLGGDSNIRDTWGLPKGDKPFIAWIGKEVWMSQLVSSGQALLDGITSNPMSAPVVISEELTLFDYFEEIKVMHRPHLFESICKDMAVAQMDRSMQVDMDRASRRLVFRYLKSLQKVGTLKTLPPITKAWSTLDGKASMFSDYMLKGESKLSDWERKSCPWWLDMAVGHCLEDEKEFFEKHRKGKVLEASSSSEEEGNIASLQHELVENISKGSPKAQVGRPKRKRLPMIDFDREENEDDQDPIHTPSSSSSFKLAFHTLYHSIESISIHSKMKISPIFESSVLCCDYVALGSHVKKGKTDHKSFQHIRDFYKKHSHGPCKRGGQDCSWSVSTVFVDLPVGGPGSLPPWNVFTEDHVLFSLGLSAAFMDDQGWVIVFAPITSVGLVERHSRAVRLNIARRFIVLNAPSFGEIEVMDMSIKVGCNPCTFKHSADKVGSLLKLNVEDEILLHYLPPSERACKESNGEAWRGGLEKSSSFMLFLLEYLCPPSGTILDLGCGTGAVMKAAKHSCRSSLSIDSDESLVQEYLLPILQGEIGKQTMNIGGLDDSQEEETYAFTVPLD